MKEAHWSWRLLRSGAFRLDGGSMFGVVPRVVWEKAVAPDERNRIPVQSNTLLLEREGRLVVIEVGCGDKLGPKERDLYALEDRSVLDALNEAGADPSGVSTVIVTHLHFDHAGALTRRPRAGEPDRPILTFPNAEIVCQRQEWDDSKANRSTMTRTYLKDHLTEEVAERLRLIDGASPVTQTGPGGPVAFGQFVFTQVLPGIEVFRVPGHTWGQQAVRFTDRRGRVIVYTPDVMPTVHHVGQAYNMAYDVEPFVSGQMRARLLDAAASLGWLLAIDHEPGNPIVRVERDREKPGVFRLAAVDE